jgi:Co/Zn/Cd efflux system component
MSNEHQHRAVDDQSATQYRKILWICLVANAVMFFVEMVGSYKAFSASLLANSIDFLSDAFNYGITLLVIQASDRSKHRANNFKGISLALTGLWAGYETIHHSFESQVPLAGMMAWISLLALAVNVFCAVLLFKYRKGDMNIRSVWICSRNDALGNIAVLFAAGGIFAIGSHWPDIVVAAILVFLALYGAYQILFPKSEHEDSCCK